MEDSKFSCLVFVCIGKQRFGVLTFLGGGGGAEMILIGQFFAVGSPGSKLSRWTIKSTLFARVIPEKQEKF